MPYSDIVSSSACVSAHFDLRATLSTDKLMGPYFTNAQADLKLHCRQYYVQGPFLDEVPHIMCHLNGIHLNPRWSCTPTV